MSDDQPDDVIKKANKTCHSPESHGELLAVDRLLASLTERPYLNKPA